MSPPFGSPGTLPAPVLRRYGRKKSCIVYLVLEIIINICEHYNNFAVLWVSRFLGGITTCILFTGFEAWMVSEHRKRGFPEAWVADTFSKGSFINGLSAIIAGILAQVCADLCGEIGPFQAAIALTALALVFVAFWPENYGGGDSDDADTKARPAPRGGLRANGVRSRPVRLLRGRSG